MGVHDGHRDRLKNRFLTQGLESLESHEVLELLLYYSVPRRDTNELAHRLIGRFGSFAGVLDASPQELCTVKGITPHTAALLKLIPSLTRRYLEDKQQKGVILDSTEKAGAYLLPKFLDQTNEISYLVSLNNRNQVLRCDFLMEGSVNATQVSVRQVISFALQAGATAVLLAHNHPQGFALPSSEDIETTLKIRDALLPLNIRLLDHIIVAQNDYVSLADSGIFLR